MFIKERFNSLKWDYILVFLLIANSAIPFFYLYIEFKIINLVILTVIFFLKSRSLDKFIIIYLGIFLSVTIGQYFVFRTINFGDSISVIIRILIAYLTVKIVMIRIFPITVNLIYAFSVISFFIYLPCIISPGIRDAFISLTPIFDPPFHDILKEQYKQIIIYNFDGIKEFRNSGPFWEAGTFGGFLIIALIINLVMTKTLVQKKSLIMILALLTTFSTTNYIALSILIIIYFIFYEKRVNPFIVTIPIVAIVILLFFNLDFMKDKIVTQISEADKYYSAGRVGNRFVSAMVDINEFLKYPLFGKGRGEIAVQIETGFNRHRSNGFFTHLVSYGIIFFLFYFINIYKSFVRLSLLYNLSKYLPYLFLFLIITIGFSEQYFNHPFFYALTMLHLSIPLKVVNYYKWLDLVTYRTKTIFLPTKIDRS